jgi:hypothetical protein
MTSSPLVIPIVQAGSASASACASAASCSSASSCGASSCGPSDSTDPAFVLQQQGWILRTTIGEPRLSEVVENYRAMGYEVHVERFGMTPAGAGAKSDGESCTVCFDAADKSQASQVWGSVYVRPGGSADKNDELFG